MSLFRSVTGALLAATTFAAPLLADDFEVVKAENYQVYVPNGFDDNDEIVVVVDGFMPNSCYKLDEASFSINEETNLITVEQLLRKYEGNCLDVRVPFNNEVRLGVLPHGKFTVAASEGQITNIFLIGEATTEGPDDHLYAPIESMSIQNEPGSVDYYAVLEGRITNTCMKWQDIKVIDSGATIEVLPIMKMEAGPLCLAVETWFRTKVDLPRKSIGRHLVHVRSLNGRSMNGMFSVRALTTFP